MVDFSGAWLVLATMFDYNFDYRQLGLARKGEPMAAPPGQGPSEWDEDPARDARGPADSPPNGRACMPSRPPPPQPARDGPPADDGARDDPIWGDADAAGGWRPVPCRAGSGAGPAA